MAMILTGSFGLLAGVTVVSGTIEASAGCAAGSVGLWLGVLAPLDI